MHEQMVSSNSSRVEKHEKRKTILEQWRGAKKEPEGIAQRKLLTLEELAQREGTSVDTIETSVRNKLLKFAEDIKNASTVDEENSELIDTIYNLYKHSQNKDLAKKYKWLNRFASLDDLRKAYFRRASAYSKAYLKIYIDSFVNECIHPERILQMHHYTRRLAYGDEVSIYDLNGDWIRIPSHNIEFGEDYVDRSVIEEIIELLKEGEANTSLDFNHESGSAALPGIEKHQAIISARKAYEEGESIKTGEAVTMALNDAGGSTSGGRRGLYSVYVSEGKPGRSSYGHVNWFDEYYVTFGINKKKQEDYLREIGFSYKDDREVLIKDGGGEGTVIGPEVPLSSLEKVYCWKMYQKEMEKWVAKNCPHLKVVSLEAMHVLMINGRDMVNMAKQENITLIEAWELILQESPKKN